MPEDTTETVTVEIPFIAWTEKAALKIKVAASIDERWRLRAAVEIAVKDGASLVGAILDRASLDGASLDGARLVGARLDGASGIICAGFDPGGYRFLGVRHADQWYVAAGFRWFTIPAAIAHWTAAKNRDALARVGVIQVAAGCA